MRTTTTSPSVAPFSSPLHDEHFSVDPPILRVDHPEGPRGLVDPDQGLVCSLQYLDHTADRAPSSGTSLHSSHHLVTVHRRLERQPGHEDLLAPRVRRDEAVTLGGYR